jgi:hypothetical protein
LAALGRQFQLLVDTIGSLQQLFDPALPAALSLIEPS